jgi:hypothetical protein
VAGATAALSLATTEEVNPVFFDAKGRATTSVAEVAVLRLRLGREGTVECEPFEPFEPFEPPATGAGVASDTSTTSTPFVPFVSTD